jgi:hypothetical protein
MAQDRLLDDLCALGEAQLAVLVYKHGIPPVDCAGAPFAALAALPANGRPVTTWPDQDEAWTDVARGIRHAVEEMRARKR